MLSKNLTLNDFYNQTSMVPMDGFSEKEDFDIQISEHIRKYQKYCQTCITIAIRLLFCYLMKQSWFSSWVKRDYMFKYFQTEPKIVRLLRRAYDDVDTLVSLHEFRSSIQYSTSNHYIQYMSNLMDYIDKYCFAGFAWRMHDTHNFQDERSLQEFQGFCLHSLQ